MISATPALSLCCICAARMRQILIPSRVSLFAPCARSKATFPFECDNKKLFTMKPRAAAVGPLPALWCKCLCSAAHNPTGLDAPRIFSSSCLNKAMKIRAHTIECQMSLMHRGQWIITQSQYRDPASWIAFSSVYPPSSADTESPSQAPTSLQRPAERVGMRYSSPSHPPNRMQQNTSSELSSDRPVPNPKPNPELPKVDLLFFSLYFF